MRNSDIFDFILREKISDDHPQDKSRDNRHIAINSIMPADMYRTDDNEGEIGCKENAQCPVRAPANQHVQKRNRHMHAGER